jgi:hypothetical protein
VQRVLEVTIAELIFVAFRQIAQFCSKKFGDRRMTVKQSSPRARAWNCLNPAESRWIKLADKESRQGYFLNEEIMKHGFVVFMRQ